MLARISLDSVLRKIIHWPPYKHISTIVLNYMVFQVHYK